MSGSAILALVFVAGCATPHGRRAVADSPAPSAPSTVAMVQEWGGRLARGESAAALIPRLGVVRARAERSVQITPSDSMWLEVSVLLAAGDDRIETLKWSAATPLATPTLGELKAAFGAYEEDYWSPSPDGLGAFFAPLVVEGAPWKVELMAGIGTAGETQRVRALVLRVEKR